MSLTPVIPQVAAGKIQGILIISVSAVSTIFIGIDAAGNFFVNGIKASSVAPILTQTTSAVFSDSELPVGSINGVNKVFLLANSPRPQTSLVLFRNGLLQQANGVDYSLSGSTITFTTAPGIGDVLIANYRF